FYESGGEPLHITDLTYDEFRNFHKQYYHPSNSFIFLYGNLPSEKTLSFLNDNYLNSFDKIRVSSEIAPQKLWSEPRKLYVEAPGAKEDDGKATVALLWLFGDTVDPVTTLAGKVIGHYLLATESSPLKRALVDSGLGEDLDDISGFDSDLVQTQFAAGLRKCDPKNAEKIEHLILETLKNQVENGLDTELLTGSLRQIEFGLREVTGGHFPYNLRLAERCYRSWIYNGDPLAHLAFDKPLEFLNEQLASGSGYFTDLIKKRLLENPHRLFATVVVSSKKGEELELQTEQQAQNLTRNFGEKEIEKYYQLTQTLLEQQKTPSPAEIVDKLPKLKKEDLPRENQLVEAEIADVNGVKVYMHPVFTSGIAYVDIGFDLKTVPKDLLPYIPVYTELLTRCGTSGVSYEQVAKQIALSTGGIDSSVVCRTMAGTENELFLHTFFHGKSLVSRFDEMLEILENLFLEPDLQNTKQVKDIILEERNGLLSSVIGSGHHYAMTHAASFLCLSQYVNEILGGIGQLRFVNELAKSEDYSLVMKAIQRLHSIVINRKSCIISVTYDNPRELLQGIEKLTNALPLKDAEMVPIKMEYVNGRLDGIELNSAVNYVAKVWKTGAIDPITAGRQFLMSRNLYTGYLWDKVRVEGGAYGGMAIASTSNPVFACASYRDPNLQTTLGHFESALESIADGISQDKVDQSIIGAIGKVDAPRSPHGKGLGETLDLVSGITREFRQKFRETILDSDSESLAEAAKKVREAQESAVVVLGGGASFDTAEKNGL
ncbi:MAG: insulinase family protein, partial [Fibrobacter sp.]|nr:insulinase family protein [Fibrobacter sp.]